MVRGVHERYDFLYGSPSKTYKKRPLLSDPDFRRRFLSLLSFKFREFGSVMALSILGSADEGLKRLDLYPAGGIQTFQDYHQPESVY